MYENLKKKIVQDMVNNGIIEKEDAELYCFGIDALKTYIGAVIMSLGVGILFHSFWESVVFLIFFKLLRAESGGYHASSNGKCIVISLLMLIGSLIVVKKCSMLVPFSVLLLFLVLSVFTVFQYAPLPDDNKPINEKEEIYHRRRARIFVIIESVVAIVLFNILRSISITILMVEIMVSLSLIAWVIIRRKKLA